MSATTITDTRRHVDKLLQTFRERVREIGQGAVELFEARAMSLLRHAFDETLARRGRLVEPVKVDLGTVYECDQVLRQIVSIGKRVRRLGADAACQDLTRAYYRLERHAQGFEVDLDDEPTLLKASA